MITYFFIALNCYQRQTPERLPLVDFHVIIQCY